MSEVHQKSSWGGKRTGAGRPKSRHSDRLIAEAHDISLSEFLTARFIRDVAPEAYERTGGERTQRQARAFASEKLLSAYPDLLKSVEEGTMPRRYAERVALRIRKEAELIAMIAAEE